MIPDAPPPDEPSAAPPTVPLTDAVLHEQAAALLQQADEHAAMLLQQAGEPPDAPWVYLATTAPVPQDGPAPLTLTGADGWAGHRFACFAVPVPVPAPPTSSPAWTVDTPDGQQVHLRVIYIRAQHADAHLWAEHISPRDQPIVGRIQGPAAAFRHKPEVTKALHAEALLAKFHRENRGQRALEAKPGQPQLETARRALAIRRDEPEITDFWLLDRLGLHKGSLKSRVRKLNRWIQRLRELEPDA